MEYLCRVQRNSLPYSGCIQQHSSRGTSSYKCMCQMISLSWLIPYITLQALTLIARRTRQTWLDI